MLGLPRLHPGHRLLQSLPGGAPPEWHVSNGRRCGDVMKALNNGGWLSYGYLWVSWGPSAQVQVQVIAKFLGTRIEFGLPTKNSGTFMFFK